MKRTLAALAAVTLVLAIAGPAYAHEEIDPATVQTGIPMFLSFSVANEKTVELRSVRLVAPQDLEFGETTREPAGWTSTRSNAAITWAGGAIKPNKFETFGFEIESPDQPGDKKYTVTMTYADNSTDNADVTLKVVAATTGAGNTGGDASSAKDDDGGGNGLAVVAIALGAAALALSLGAMARSRKAGAGGGGGAGSAPAGAKQDW